MKDVRLLTEPFNPGQLVGPFTEAHPGLGGVCTFVGEVRGGDGTEALELSHYEPLTLAGMDDLAEQALARFDLMGILIAHRVGEMHPGEPIVLVSAAARHRRAASTAASMPSRNAPGISATKEKHFFSAVFLLRTTHAGKPTGTRAAREGGSCRQLKACPGVAKKNLREGTPVAAHPSKCANFRAGRDADSSHATDQATPAPTVRDAQPSRRIDAAGCARTTPDAIDEAAIGTAPEKENGRLRGRSGDSFRSVKDQ